MPGTPPMSHSLLIAIGRAEATARRFTHDYLGPQHVLMSILMDEDLINDVAILRLFPAEAVEEHFHALGALRPSDRPVPDGPLPYTSRTKRALAFAGDLARQRGAREITPRHLLAGLIREGRSVAARLLSAKGITEDLVWP